MSRNTDTEVLFTCGDHEVAIGFELSYTSGEWYGTDADGNRGVWQSGYYEVASSPPDRCPECDRVFTNEELIAIEKLAEKAAEDHEPPDYDDD